LRARPTEMQIGSKLWKPQCSKRFGMRDAARSVSERASVLQRQGLTALPSTSSHPVPKQSGHEASFMSADSEIIYVVSLLVLAKNLSEGNSAANVADDNTYA
jgi:hypothetical protein